MFIIVLGQHVSIFIESSSGPSKKADSLIVQQEHNDTCILYIVLSRMWVIYSLQPGHYSSLPSLNFQPTATQERDDRCGNIIVVSS